LRNASSYFLVFSFFAFSECEFFIMISPRYAAWALLRD
jgi:hypothetical protein